jgi:hypothetical protein
MASPASQAATPATLTSQVERVHAAVAVVAMLIALAVAARPVWSAVLAGTLVGAANFRVLALLTQRLVSGTTSTKNAAIALLLFKFIGLIAVLGVIVLWLKPDSLTFLIALTLAPLCLLVVVLRRRPDPAAPSAVEVR